MAFQVSPGSNAEIDLTTRVPIPSLSQAAMCMISKWKSHTRNCYCFF